MATAGWRRDDLPTPGALPGRSEDSPLSAGQLETAGLVGRGWEHFGEPERAVAVRLSLLGIELRSVGRASAFQTPDGIILATGQTVEIKTQVQPTFGALRYHVRRGRRQSRSLVVAISDSGVTEDLAAGWLRRALGRYGGGYDEVLVLGESFGILWP